jgi:hypothetical protein
MENFKLPIALVVAMVLQISGGVWWVSQQAATINSLKETVEAMSSRMAIEDQVNLKRDVQRNYEEVDMIWEEVDMMAGHMDRIIDLQQRVTILEKEIGWMQNPMH